MLQLVCQPSDSNVSFNVLVIVLYVTRIERLNEETAANACKKIEAIQQLTMQSESLTRTFKVFPAALSDVGVFMFCVEKFNGCGLTDNCFILRC